MRKMASASWRIVTDVSGKVFSLFLFFDDGDTSARNFFNYLLDFAASCILTHYSYVSNCLI